MGFATRAVVMERPGPPEVLVERDVELAWPGAADQVLVRVSAVGVNPADASFRAEGPYLGDGAGCVLGHDAAGIVEALGGGVTRVKTGDRVCFCHGGIGAAPGTYAAHAVVPERLLVRVPDGVELVQAAALPLVFITAHEALVERAVLSGGERVLVHAGGGGTGHVAVQVARLLGAKVASTVSSEEKARLVEELGVERPIRYRDEDFVAAVRQWTNGRGVQVAMDNVGGEVLRRTYKAMALYGRVVTIMGTVADGSDGFAHNSNLTISNLMMLTPMWRELRERLAHQADAVAKGMEWLAAGKLRVHICATLPLADAAEAHRRMEAGGMTGKLVLVTGD